MIKPYLILAIMLIGCSQPATNNSVEVTTDTADLPSDSASFTHVNTKAKFYLFGMSSEGSEVLAEINDGKLGNLSIESYGAMGTTTMIYDKHRNTLESNTVFLPKTGLPPKQVTYNISVDQDGAIKIFDASNVEESFLECALSKVIRHVESYTAPYPELHINCP